jgi:hypothetical protein
MEVELHSSLTSTLDGGEPSPSQSSPVSRYGEKLQIIQYTALDSRQWVVLKLGGWAKCLQIFAIKSYHVTRHFTPHIEGWLGTGKDFDVLEKINLLLI